MGMPIKGDSEINHQHCHESNFRYIRQKFIILKNVLFNFGLRKTRHMCQGDKNYIPIYFPIPKINLKWINDFNVRPVTLSALLESVWGMLKKVDIGYVFLNNQETVVGTDRCYYIR